MMIDMGNCANIIVKIALEKMSLKAELHSHPYNVKIGLVTQLNLLPNVVRSISTCPSTRIVFSVIFRH